MQAFLSRTRGGESPCPWVGREAVQSRKP